MKAINFKRTVLASIMGSSMAFGLVVSSSADARLTRDQQSGADTPARDKQDEDAKAARKREREVQQELRAEQARTQTQRQDGYRRQLDEVQSRQRQPVQGEQSQQRASERYAQERAQAQERSQAQAQQRQYRVEQVRPSPEQRDDRFAAQRAERNAAQAYQRNNQVAPQDYDRNDQVAPRQHDRNDRSPARQQAQPRYDDRQQADRSPGVRDDGRNRPVRERDRLPEPQRQTLIAQQRQQAAQFSRQAESRRVDLDRYGSNLQRQHRDSQYRYQQDYYDRMRRYSSRYDYRTYNYYNDPYFYTAPRYRYYRGGSYFSINAYGANLLQQAINFGYGEGMRAGRADRMDGWRFDYRGSYAYRDANYGYSGFYVRQAEYNYYFRRGFERGYEDGYYGRRQYGRYYNGADMLLGSVMSMIFNVQLH